MVSMATNSTAIHVSTVVQAREPTDKTSETDCHLSQTFEQPDSNPRVWKLSFCNHPANKEESKTALAKELDNVICTLALYSCTQSTLSSLLASVRFM